jgi:hypothetical protein
MLDSSLEPDVPGAHRDEQLRDVAFLTEPCEKDGDARPRSELDSWLLELGAASRLAGSAEPQPEPAEPSGMRAWRVKRAEARARRVRITGAFASAKSAAAPAESVVSEPAPEPVASPTPLTDAPPLAPPQAIAIPPDDVSPEEAPGLEAGAVGASTVEASTVEASALEAIDVETAPDEPALDEAPIRAAAEVAPIVPSMPVAPPPILEEPAPDPEPDEERVLVGVAAAGDPEDDSAAGHSTLLIERINAYTLH